ncbi:MAG: M3 family metallopeptidase [Actinomycetia bacterium]|nr:M3 family metallopeptidase [Actinomycetes bacterium]
MTNPLLAEQTLPYGIQDFTSISDADWRQAIEEGMTQQRAALDALATSTEPATVANVLEAWERSDELLSRASAGFWTLKSSDTNDERDQIETDLSPALAAHSTAITLDRRLYDRLQALRQRADAGEVELDAESEWLLSERLRQMRRLGIDLPADKQQRLRELNEQIATLEARWSVTVVAGRNAAAVHVRDESRLAGLTEADLAAAREAAERRGVDGWVLELVNTTGQPMLARLQDRSLREELFRASISRGDGGEHDTRGLVVELARLRAELAELLGFEHFAAFVADDGCAKTTAAVNEILARVAPAAVRNAEREAAPLRARLQADHPGAELQPWDWQYYAEQERAARFSLDSEALRAYLPFERVLEDGVLAAATGLYGITFSRRDDVPGYTDESRVYEVHDHDGRPMALVVLDPYARPSKQGGAWMTSIIDQSRLLGRLPVVTNNCNLVRPAPGQPTLMSWTSVITLFHEFGHDLHGLLSDVRYPSQSGTAVPRDFVEFPSQVNEAWAWDRQLLARYARHHETGEPMPSEWIDTLLEARHFDEGYAAVEAFAAMILDQVWHQTPAAQLPTSAEEVVDFERRALEAHQVAFPLVPPRYRTTYFSHIWGGGYSAGYYSYLWAEVLDADTVAWFTENGGLTRKNGDWFRDQLLSRGGSQDAMESYRQFRGGDPDVMHLLERRGLV